MDKYKSYLEWLEGRKGEMLRLVERWAGINSGSFHPEGLEKMSQEVQKAFEPIGGTIQEMSLAPLRIIDDEGEESEAPLGKAVRIRMRPKAPIQVFLGGHLDTVFPKDSPFQSCRSEEGKLIGPGVADLKGGLVVILMALQAFERTPFAEGLGWEVLLNPDEEIGTPRSHQLLQEAAQRCHVGLVFEPAMPDGSYVDFRKGSYNMTVIVKGRAAHAGRDFHQGRNAIAALARFVDKLDRLNSPGQDTTINVGRIVGGVAANIVPDRATCRVTARMNSNDEFERLTHQFQQIAKEGEAEGIELQMKCTSYRAPKIFDPATQKLFLQIQNCLELFGKKMHTLPTGGVCDGNILAEAGLPTIDTMGVRGGKMHTFEEFLLVDSLVESASLAALYLMRLADHDLPIIKERTYE